MTTTQITIPQLGEGLQEVLIREFLKKPGEAVRRDEPIYLMETDKATVEAQAPMDGTLLEWLAQLNDTVSVGSPVARIGVAENLHGVQGVRVEIEAGAFGNSHQSPAHSGPPPLLSTEGEPPPSYTDHPLTVQQKALVFRLSRSSSVVTGNVARSINWQRLGDIMRELAAREVPVLASEFQIFAYCVSQASKLHPKLRSMVLNNSIVREHHHLNLGVAVARPNDDLITAVVPAADQMGLVEFLNSLKRQIRRAWREGDQVSATTQLILSYLGSYGVTGGVPALVPPASGVLFLGAAYEQQNQRLANLSLTFDHRLINGVAAARFLAQVDHELDGLQTQLNLAQRKEI